MHQSTPILAMRGEAARIPDRTAPNKRTFPLSLGSSQHVDYGDGSRSGGFFGKAMWSGIFSKDCTGTTSSMLVPNC